MCGSIEAGAAMLTTLVFRGMTLSGNRGALRTVHTECSTAGFPFTLLIAGPKQQLHTSEASLDRIDAVGSATSMESTAGCIQAALRHWLRVAGASMQVARGRARFEAALLG